MQFRIADTFTDSLRKLNGDEQKTVKNTAFELQLELGNPGMQMHRIDKSKDANFWSVRASRDLRLIVHRTNTGILLCYVDHHDKAYAWAERRRITTHPKTGAAQIVELRETIEQITIPSYVQPEEQLVASPPIFSAVADDSLLNYGIPPDWLADVREVRDEDGLFALTDHLPAEASEALIELATGGTPLSPAADAGASIAEDPFEHPDARRRFRTIEDREELAAALDYPWDKWTIFLHPSQRSVVERDFNGPARVSGSAGTGKTIVALHRAVFLARKNENARVLLTTFNNTLASTLKHKLRRLLAHQPSVFERIEVKGLDQLAIDLYSHDGSTPAIATEQDIKAAIQESARALDINEFSSSFLFTEWRTVVDAWQIEVWHDYRTVRRLGRQIRLPEGRREKLWSIFQGARKRLHQRNATTLAQIYANLSSRLHDRRHPLFEHVVVDEAQDISVAQLKFLAALAPNEPNALFFAGDLGQRIFQTPFSWSSLGIEIRGRSSTLRINYRTSQQIRATADRLLDASLSDIDGNVESRDGTVSLFNGVLPSVQICRSEAEEIAVVADWLKDRIYDIDQAAEIAVVVRSKDQLTRGERAIETAGFDAQLLEEQTSPDPRAVTLATMHHVKGLEFRALAMMACDDNVIPLASRLSAAADSAEHEEIFATERHLLYVAMTRARDALLITGKRPISDFVADLDLT